VRIGQCGRKNTRKTELEGEFLRWRLTGRGEVHHAKIKLVEEHVVLGGCRAGRDGEQPSNNKKKIGLKSLGKGRENQPRQWKFKKKKKLKKTKGGALQTRKAAKRIKGHEVQSDRPGVSVKIGGCGEDTEVERQAKLHLSSG